MTRQETLLSTGNEITIKEHSKLVCVACPVIEGNRRLTFKDELRSGSLLLFVCYQRDRTRRALLQYQNFSFTWAGLAVFHKSSTI